MGVCEFVVNVCRESVLCDGGKDIEKGESGVSDGPC